MVGESAIALDQRLADSVAGSPSSQLQAIVDEASRVLQRPIAIDDRHHRLLAHTQHGEEEVDRTRLMSIMKQPLSSAVFDWLDKHGAWHAENPFRTPPNEDLELDARVGAPILCQNHCLGWVWCTDRDQTMTDADLDRIGAFADEAAVVLYREILLLDLDRSRERELLRDILSSDPGIRGEAAWRLAELDLFVPRTRVAALVIVPDELTEEQSPEAARIALDAALMRIRRHLAPKHALHLIRPTHAVLVVSLADPGLRSEGVSAFAARVHDDLLTALPSERAQPRQIVAVGGRARELTSAIDSYKHALRAADVAATVSTFGDVVSWDDLGIYQLLTEFPLDVLGPNSLHTGLSRLLEDPRAQDLLPTLERYLDLAGDVQETAATLYLHRTTLYHRLRKIERVAGVDLSKGDDRLALHLSLKLAKLQGIDLPTQVD